MTWFFKQLLSSGLVMGTITLLYLAVLPFLQKRYRASALYAISLILAVGFLVPFRPLVSAPAVTVQVPLAFSQPVMAMENAFPFGARSPGEGPAAGNGFPLEAKNADALQRAATPGGAPVSLGGEREANARRATLTLWDALAAVWLAGFGVILVVQGRRHMRFVRTCRRWRRSVMQAKTREEFDALRRDICPRSRASLAICPAVETPMLMGFFRPVVFLPDESLSGEELTMVLKHELTHLRRRDLWAKAGLLFMAAANWFNPAAWMLLRWAAFAQETACDERVTAGGSPQDKIFYSETILRTIRHQARLHTAFTTAFYSGKKGMKRRISAIIAGGSRLGTALCGAMLALTLLAGTALGITDTALSANGLEAGKAAYVLDNQTAGTRMLLAPSGNDWTVPQAAYFNGTPVTVLELLTGGSTLPEWGLEENGTNWARVAIGGDGISQGLMGFIPVCFLAAEAPQGELPSATLTAQTAEDYVSLYHSYDEASGLLTVRPGGEKATLLGTTGYWMHLLLEGAVGFAPVESVTIGGEVTTALESFQADVFDNFPYEDYQALILDEYMMTEKIAQYGTDNVSLWPMEGKAWLSSRQALGGFDSRDYQYPGEEDLSEAAALDIAWNEYARLLGFVPGNRAQYKSWTGLYHRTLNPEEQKEWEVTIAPAKGAQAFFYAVIDNSGGAVLFAGPEETFQRDGDIPAEELLQMTALLQWEAQKGIYPFWTVEDKAAFSTEYGYDNGSILPGSDAIPQEEALRIAKDAATASFGWAEAELSLLQPSFSYSKWDESVFVWNVSFYNGQGESQVGVNIDAHTREVYGDGSVG